MLMWEVDDPEAQPFSFTEHVVGPQSLSSIMVTISDIRISTDAEEVVQRKYCEPNTGVAAYRYVEQSRICLTLYKVVKVYVPTVQLQQKSTGPQPFTQC